MSSLPYYPRYPRDFLDATIGMSFAEKGAYGIVLDLIYMRGGRLEDDPRYVAGQLNCSVRMWKGLLASLIQRGKLTLSDGFIANNRADNIVEKLGRFQDKQAENRSNPNKNNDVKSPKTDQSKSESKKKKEREESKTPAVADELPDFEVFWLAYPRKVAKDAARKVYAVAIKRIGGADPASVILTALVAQSGRWTDLKFTPHPATWLNQGRWTDEIDPSEGTSDEPNHPRGSATAPPNARRSNTESRRDAWAELIAEDDARRGVGEPGGDGGGVPDVRRLTDDRDDAGDRCRD